jgi:hypothetical protein
MIPLSALLQVKTSAGPERATRYNGFLSADVNASAAPGFSSGQAQDVAKRIAAETLPPGFDYEWTDLTYQEILAGNSAVTPARQYPIRIAWRDSQAPESRLFVLWPRGGVLCRHPLPA